MAPKSAPRPRQPAPKMRRTRKMIYHRLRLKVKDGIRLPSHDPSIDTPTKKTPKPTPLNRWHKYHPCTLNLNDTPAIFAAIQRLKADIEEMEKKEEHYQPYTSYHYKKSCVLEGAEKQLEELRVVVANIKEAQMGFVVLPEIKEDVQR
ncbi:hypothetical protein Slin14017_G125110 [Septoria linicola]|nr:hypothetical protein Slin14017_G125110 [Septoria linicola]